MAKEAAERRERSAADPSRGRGTNALRTTRSTLSAPKVPQPPTGERDLAIGVGRFQKKKSFLFSVVHFFNYHLNVFEN
jgi:hypothetical protein